MRTALPLLLLIPFWTLACAETDSADERADEPKAPSEAAGGRSEPAYVTVDHILIGVRGELPVQRTKAQAAELVAEIRKKLDAGESWDALKQKYSDDRSASGVGGPYAMANHRRNPGRATPRGNMVEGFGDVSFSLEVGEIGVAEYDPWKSKWGYHIIKRIK